MQPVASVRTLAEPLARAAGLQLEDVVISGQGAGRKVTVTVDLPENELGGVDLEDVAELSRALSAALDEGEVMAGAYRLEVTTPGVSRPLTERRHFNRARGRLVRLETDDGDVLGRIRGVRDGSVVLHCADGDRAVPLTSITRGRVQVEFSPPPADFALITDTDATSQDRKGASRWTST